MIAFSLMVLFIVKTLSVRITDAFLLYRVKVRIVSLLTKYNEKKIRIPDVIPITRIRFQTFFVVLPECFTFVADSTQGVACLESFFIEAF